MHRKTFVAACVATSLIGAAKVNALATESDYNLETAGGTLFGTLRLPEPAAATVPVVLIVAGSGPTDRNGNGPMLALNTYAKIASALAENGIATVRYDKRGIASSRATSTSEADLRFDSYVVDVVAWIAKLRADKRFARVILAGHSEGSLVGMIAAQRAPVDAYVSLDGAGFPAADVLRTQLRSQLAAYPKLAAQAEAALSTLSAGKTVPAADVPPELMSLLRPSVQPYLISWFKYDPRVEIAKLTKGVTIVQGTHDVQVLVADGQALAAANKSATYVLIEGMTHVLADDPATTVEGQLKGAYADTMRPLDTTLVRTLVTIATAG